MPWQFIDRYAARKRLDEGMIPVFMRIIRILDNEYLDWAKEQRETKMRARDRDPTKKPSPDA